MPLRGCPQRIPAIPAQSLQLAFVEEDSLDPIMALPVMYDRGRLDCLGLKADFAERVIQQMAPTQAPPSWILI